MLAGGGLHATQLALRISGSRGSVPRARYAKGNYFGLEGASPFSSLVYPVPEEAGLGTHATVDLAGRCRFGPDVEWLEPGPDGTLDYTVDPARAEAFYDAVRTWYPGLREGSLFPDYSGVRPKIQEPGEPARDFAVVGEAKHGVPGLVNLFGIESPGLTCSLALAHFVVSTLDGRGSS